MSPHAGGCPLTLIATIYAHCPVESYRKLPTQKQLDGKWSNDILTIPVVDGKTNQKE
jgi:hypothetical protein